MKKLISILLSLSLVFGLSVTAFAEDAKLTPEQKEARNAYMETYKDKKAQLDQLRADTKAAIEANNAVSKQIKDKLKSSIPQDIQDKITKIKSVNAQNKPLVEQAKSLVSERQNLLQQLKEARQSKDRIKIDSLKPQIADLNAKISNIKQQVKSNNETVKDYVNEVKTYTNARKELKNTLKPMYDQSKALRDKIKQEEKDKNALWASYRDYIKAKDYASAAKTFDSILQSKAQILSDIKARGEILTGMLNSIK